MRYVLLGTLLSGVLSAGLIAGEEPPAPAAGRVSAELMPTYQLLQPAGQTVTFPGRPVDLVVARDGRHVYVKDNRGIVVLDRATWKAVQTLPFQGAGGSMHGILLSSDGRKLYATTAQDRTFEAEVDGDGRLTWLRQISLPGPEGKGASYPCGMALSPDGKQLFVCLSRNNSLAEVDLASGKVMREISVGVAPIDVLLTSDGKTAFVANWGGRRPRAGEKTAPSSGTPVVVDDRGIGRSGSVGKVDLAAGKQVAEVETGLHPCELALHPASGKLVVANANSDTVTVLDAGSLRVREQINVRPAADLLYGSMPNALSLTADGKTLYVANGGNNAIAVIELAAAGKSRVAGFLPTAWFPGAVKLHQGELLVACVKGLGSRTQKNAKGRGVYDYTGVVLKVPLPAAAEWKQLDARVRAAGRIPAMLRAMDKQRDGVRPVPVPARVGEPSVFEHVVYVIKENRTYDQLFGDLPQGDGDPKLCIYGRRVTPNHHALAEQFILLDNFYCNGVLSSDGHSWAIEGNVTDYLEKSFGGFTRSYAWGDDALSYSSSGFLWDHVLLQGLSFRNYGEFDYASPVPATAKHNTILKDFTDRTNRIKFTQSIGIEPLRRYSCPDFPGWNMEIPDVVRAGAFLKELAEFEKKGQFPNLTIVYLPQDHTSGLSPGAPHPETHMADNDLALGQIVEALSRSRFWPKTCIFVVEDDPQDGFDHVDGHRSIGLVISPYTRGKGVSHAFYNQTSVLHTMLRILGCPPMNQMVAISPLMTECFADRPDLTPFKAEKPGVPLDRLNAGVDRLDQFFRGLAEQSRKLDLHLPDRAEEDVLNRILWHAARGTERYPAELAGAHGTGLKRRKLLLVPDPDDDDD